MPIDAPRFAGNCTVLALAGFRIDRHHARAEDQRGPDRGALILIMSIFPAQIEARHRGRSDIAHAVSDHPPEAACASGRRSRRTVAGRDLRMKLVFAEPRYAQAGSREESPCKQLWSPRLLASMAGSSGIPISAVNPCRSRSYTATWVGRLSRGALGRTSGKATAGTRSAPLRPRRYDRMRCTWTSKC